jgi:hypothetical protein
LRFDEGVKSTKFPCGNDQPLPPPASRKGHNEFLWGVSGMALVGWALAALCFMGLANSQAFVFSRKQVEPSGSAGVAASPSVQWLTAR